MLGGCDVLFIFGGNMVRVIFVILVWFCASVGFCADGASKEGGGDAAEVAGKGKQERKSEAEYKSQLAGLVKGDHLGLLKTMFAYYEDYIDDYTGTLYKQERIRGKVEKQQVVSFKFMDEPFSMAMKWTKNAGAADRMVFVAGENDGKMVVHPTGFFSWIRSVKREPDCEAAMKVNLYSCDHFGIRNMLSRILMLQRAVQKDGEIKTETVGEKSVDGRKCVVIRAMLPESKASAVRRMELRIDTGYFLPVELTTWDAKENLIGSYIYKDLKFNVGLSADEFTPKANKL
jgi:hypothetical protein